jgi:lambda repressor-like predicted transcriptional regulator
LAIRQIKKNMTMVFFLPKKGMSIIKYPITIAGISPKTAQNIVSNPCPEFSAIIKGSISNCPLLIEW